MKIKFGHRDIEFPSSDLTQLEDSNSLLEDMPALRERMAKDGYVLLRGLIDRDTVLQARQTILQHMEEHHVLSPDTSFLEGVMPLGGRSLRMMGRKGIVTHPDIVAVLENPSLFEFFQAYFEEPAISFNYKWLRAVGNEEYTGAHMDNVYMGQGSPRLHTVWIPFADIDVEQGTLAMCKGSNHLESFAKIRRTYGKMDVDRDKIEGWFTRDPMEIVENVGGQWVTGSFKAGDVILFGMHTMHASTTNMTNRYRLSCDVRFQPASEIADSRWIGDSGGHHNILETAPLKSMENARIEWDV
jgi:hypothetical protein